MLAVISSSDYDAVLRGVDDYVVPSAWGNNAGMVGALTLAAHALQQPGLVPPPSRVVAGAGGRWTTALRAIGTLALVGALAAAAVARPRSSS